MVGTRCAGSDFQGAKQRLNAECQTTSTLVPPPPPTNKSDAAQRVPTPWAVMAGLVPIAFYSAKL